MFREHRRYKPKWFISDAIEIRNSDIHGRGVFAAKDIEQHELIEACHVVTFHKQFLAAIYPHILNEYVFKWNSSTDCLCFGYGGLYNHSTPFPNVKWYPNYDYRCMEFHTTRKIKQGEELLVRYVPIARKDRLWFGDENGEDTHFVAPNARGHTSWGMSSPGSDRNVGTPIDTLCENIMTGRMSATGSLM